MGSTRSGNSPIQTRLALRDIGCEELERDLAASLLGRWRSAQTEPATPPPDVNVSFQASLAEIIGAIQETRRFALLKRFIVHGCLLPSWYTKSNNSPNPLKDGELVKCVNFITGHMVTKFQGELAEILARQALRDFMLDLQADGELPVDSSLVFGDEIRCRSPRCRGSVKGPDALYVTAPANAKIRIHAIAEIKSGYVSPAELDSQGVGHLAAVRRGVFISHTWYEPPQIRTDEPPLRVYVTPSTWPLSRRFHWEPTANGRVLIMDEQNLPLTPPVPKRTSERVWDVKLAWSHDALRAAGFRLAHAYMAEVGEALAAEGLARKDMSPGDAGMNDLLHQLHIAIFRQQDVEPNKGRREKTINLYNVLGFGWALGHEFRDKDGDIAILYPEDLDAPVRHEAVPS